jgi:hypothetical protein
MWNIRPKPVGSRRFEANADDSFVSHSNPDMPVGPMQSKKQSLFTEACGPVISPKSFSRPTKKRRTVLFTIKHTFMFDE